MLKQMELANPTSCLNKAAPDEPVFVLRAKDALAAQTVRLWAAMAFERHEPEKLKEALDLADRMDKWRQERQPKEAGTAIGSSAGYVLGDQVCQRLR